MLFSYGYDVAPLVRTPLSLVVSRAPDELRNNGSQW
jgi:hypothetical protein